MKNLFFSVITLFISEHALLAQNVAFQETFTIDNAPASAEAIAQTSDNGFAIAGETNVNGNAESFLSRFGSDGAIEWTKVFYDNQSHIISNGVNDTEILCNQLLRFLVATSDDGFILGGGIDSSVFITYSNGVQVSSDFFRMFLIKTDANGNLLWSKKYSWNDYDGAAAIVEDAEHGGYFVAAYAHQPGFVITDDLFIRLDNDGNIVWSKSFGGAGNEGVSDLKKTGDGNYIFCGVSESFSNNQNIYVVKMDTSGNLLWSKTYGTSGFDYGKSILQSPDGGYFIYGNAGNGNPSYIAVIKTDGDGNLIWSNTYGNSLLDGPLMLRYAPDGGLLALVDHYTGQHDGFLIHIDTLGNTIADKSFGVQGISKNDFITSVLPWQNSFLFAGSTNSYSSSQYIFDGYFIKTDPDFFTACNTDSLNADPAALSLTVADAATNVVDVTMNSYLMQVTEMDSDFIADTLCSSVFTTIPQVNKAGADISLFPNPASNQIHLHSEKLFTRLRICNMVGKEMTSSSYSLTGDQVVDVSNLPAGIYFVTIFTSDGEATRSFSIIH